MSIDREFRFLSKHWNSSNDWENIKTTVNKWDKKPFKMGNFVKNNTLKYLIPVLMLGIWYNKLSKTPEEKTIYDESTASVVLEDDNVDYTNLIKLKTPNFLSDDEMQNFNDNAWGIMYDEYYDHNYISGIPLDEEFDYAPWTHIFQTTKENLYRTMYRKLSTDDYQKLFKWLKNLRQWSLGNCYFVVAIKNLARSKYFDTLMMTSIERNGEDSFNLYMPLWEPGWIRISITKKDLEATTIWWPLWYKILEIWFAKYLLFKKWIILSPDITMIDKLMKKMEVWSSWETMMSLLWPKSFINKCIKNENSNKLQILNWIRNYDPKNLWTISVTSKFKEWKTDKNYYELWWETIYYGHAYSVCGIEKEWDIIKNVILENPWNNNKKWGRKIKLSVSDFLDSFSLFNFGHKTENFLNMSTTNNEIKVIDSRDRSKS